MNLTPWMFHVLLRHATQALSNPSTILWHLFSDLVAKSCGWDIVKVSSKSGDNVHECFVDIGRAILHAKSAEALSKRKANTAGAASGAGTLSERGFSTESRGSAYGFAAFVFGLFGL